jgi:hypothetical protein
MLGAPGEHMCVGRCLPPAPSVLRIVHIPPLYTGLPALCFYYIAQSHIDGAPPKPQNPGPSRQSHSRRVKRGRRSSHPEGE